MRILLAHNAYAKPSGEEHAVQAIGRLLVDHGHDVRWFWRSSADIGGGLGQVKAFFSGIYSRKSYREMLAELLANPVDIVQVQNLYPLLSPSILAACRQMRVPVVMRCPNYRLFCPTGLHLSHGEVCERCLGGHEWWCFLKNCDIGGNRFRSFSYSVRAMTARWTRAILDNVDVFIVLSEFQRQRFIAGGIPPERIAVVPNIAPEIGDSTESSNGEALGDLVSFVGRVSSEKGIEDFVAAARRLPEIPFAVAGNHDAMPELVASSPRNVKWMGFQDEPALNTLYRQSRILVFPSRWFEGFPNVITRAMLHGKPVVASRIGALPEILRQGACGVMFDPRDVGKLVEVLRGLYSDPRRCRDLGSAGRLRAQSDYSSANVYSQLFDAYQLALKSEPAA